MLNDPDPAKRGEIEDGTKKAFLKPQMPGWESGQEGKGAFGPCSRYTLAYVEPRLSPPDAAPTPADEGRGTLHTGPARPIILSHYRNIGVGAIGTALFDSSWIWRTHPRSAASSNSSCFTIGSSISNAHLNIPVSHNSGGQQRSASRTEAAQTSRPRQRVFHQMLRADVRTHGDHIAAVRTISTNESPVSPTATQIENSARHPEALPWRSIPPVRWHWGGPR